MLNVKRILFAQDFSDSSAQALPYALDLAVRTQADLHVVHADVLHTEPVDRGTADPDDAPRLQERLRRLTSDQAPGSFDLAQVSMHHAVVRDLAPAPGLLNYADENDIDLIVMGTHGRRGVQHLLLGSVAREVVRRATCPVLTIRQRRAPRKDLEAHHILVPVDFSDHSREALRLARNLADREGSELILLHVVEETLHPAFYNISFASIYDVDPHVDEKAVRGLRDFYEEAGGPDVPYEVAVRPGHAAREITRFAEQENVDVLVMATHGLTGLEHFLLGSVAEKVVGAASCPVFTVKSFGRSIVSEAGTERSEVAE